MKHSGNNAFYRDRSSQVLAGVFVPTSVPVGPHCLVF